MLTPRHLLCTGIFAVYLISPCVPAKAQVPSAEVIEGMGAVIDEKERQRQRERERIFEQRREEEAIRRQQEEMRRNPGAYPRERYSHEAALNENPWAREARRRAGAPVQVEIFVAERCFDCDRMERYLDDVGVPYIRHFLEPGNEAEEQYLAQIGRGRIPVVRINGRVVRGFEPEEVRKIILEEKPR